MTYIQTFVILSTVFFVALSVMLNSENIVGMMLKFVAVLMAIFGVVMSLASLGIVFSNGVRLI